MIGTRSFMAKGEEVERKWYIIDAENKPLGRLAVQVARILSGKHKPTYTPHVDTGDFVVVINAEKVGLTGNKLTQSTISKHSGHPGGLKVLTYKQILERRPERLVERVVWGMLPKTKLGRDMYRKLKVYAGAAHPHAAQKPEQID
ncbi:MULTISPECIES: 50S ribosomal protein L13 [Cloacibacillus]|jgi:large subunit ribosomal protein L13|uniref:Large ribosomal subunit protein uL13 n=1 Tax=Cloacibacillus porcorum TaxID=1197717 RepID=A0A1B2I291_9BACT|nr:MULTISPECIES: 50S ribosomal protein L13 [Cloacibacillus]MCD7953659.1 50S ribosomal protein L13 [Synergistaceae bacterium]ANZ44095.1 50S ribosomal protein L13 [Cloacibacillus porcorum]MCC8183275.1 50S ribosomal protein L13 [Cloacibacillus porcorum]MCD7876500.1 50S ribosomal protein L13 [Cloacibacillus porcorum]MCD8234035.1 50S ribosomal protein L13 [Cloacibacillus porcorum]